MINGDSWDLKHAIGFFTPFIRDFRDPVLSSTLFELIVQACHRRPEWLIYLNVSSESIYRIHPWIAHELYREGFHGHVAQYLASCPLCHQESERRFYLSTIARECVYLYESTMIELLENVSLDALSQSDGILPYAQLAILLFDTIDWEWYRPSFYRFMRHLLQKCGGIEYLSTWRVLVARPTLNCRRAPGRPWVHSTNDGTYQHFGIVEGIGRKQVVTLMETTMLHAYTACKIQSSGPLQILRNEAQSQNHIKSTLQPKVILIVELTLNKLDLVVDISSKPIRGAETSQLLITHIEHQNNDPDSQSRSSNEKGTSGEDSNSNIPATFSLIDFHNAYHEPKLNSRQTVEYLVGEGYMSPESLEAEDPLQTLVCDDYRAKESPKLAGFDWSVQVDESAFVNAFTSLLERQRRMENPRAVAPCRGGALFWQAIEYWVKDICEAWNIRDMPVKLASEDPW